MSRIAISGNVSGTGVFTLASPATNTDRTLTLPDEAGTVVTSASSLAAANLTGTIAKARLPAGSVLQVVQGTNVTGSTGTTATVDIVSASITPLSASSKILVLGHISFFSQVDHGNIVLRRNSTSIFVGTSGTTMNGTISSSFDNNNYGTNGNASYGVGSIAYLDSPNTTSSTTYLFRGGTTGGGATWNVNRSQTTFQGSTSSIILMEIAA